MPSTQPPLAELQSILEHEIPMCRQMGMRVCACDRHGLVIALPLDQNRNHQQTAFAGSLNALCTIAGWGTVFLLLRELGLEGSVVIRRSSIRYQQPVIASEILARCHPVTDEARSYFVEMLADKKQAKLDLTVEIPGQLRPSVVFHGSYVVVTQ